MVYLPHCWTAATCVAIMLLPMLFSAACSSILFGIISDRTNRRKPIVIAAGIELVILLKNWALILVLTLVLKHLVVILLKELCTWVQL